MVQCRFGQTCDTRCPRTDFLKNTAYLGEVPGAKYQSNLADKQQALDSTARTSGMLRPPLGHL